MVGGGPRSGYKSCSDCDTSGGSVAAGGAHDRVGGAGGAGGVGLADERVGEAGGVEVETGSVITSVADWVALPLAGDERAASVEPLSRTGEFIGWASSGGVHLYVGMIVQ